MDGEAYTHRTNYIAHGRTQIDVVYTNEEKVLKETLDMYQQWLGYDDFVGLDLEYTKPDPTHQTETKVAAVQLAMRTHVVVYHLSWYVIILHILVLNLCICSSFIC